MKTLDRLIVMFLAVVFVFSGVDKVFHYEGFLNALRNYVLVPRGTAPLFALPVISLEILIGLSLLVKSWRRSAALSGALLLVLFSIALGVNYIYGERGICGCWFTITLARGTSLHLVQNLILIAMALVVWWEDRGQHEVEDAPAPANANAQALS